MPLYFRYRRRNFLLSYQDVQRTNRIWGVRFKPVKSDNTSVLTFQEKKHKFHKFKDADQLDLAVLNQDPFLGRLLLGIDYCIQNGNTSPSHRALMTLLGVKSSGYLQEGLAILEYVGAISIEKVPFKYPTSGGIKSNSLRFSHKYTVNVLYGRI